MVTTRQPRFAAEAMATVSHEPFGFHGNTPIVELKWNWPWTVSAKPVQ